MPSSNNNKKSEEGELTVKEASSKLDISEATVRKYLKDFDLGTVKGAGNKAVISEETFQALSEIAKLRANGLSIQEIKELKSQEPSRKILEELEETESTKANAIEEEKTLSDSVETTVSLNGDAADVVEESKESIIEEDGEAEEVSEQKQVDEEQVEGQRRRRLFNYRYVERQISNDSKRISSLRQRLRNPNLSVQDRLFFEEALERRILFLDGWKHILRWISK